MRFEEAVRRAYQIPGMCWPSELGALYRLFRGSTRHVEVGAFCGRSLFTTAMVLGRDAELIIVEPFLGCNADEFPLPGPRWQRQVLAATIAAIEHHRPDIRWTLLDNLSLDALPMIGTCQSCYIDGDHGFAECSADIVGYQAITTNTLAGHDYWAAIPSVMEAVNQNLEKFRVLPKTRIWVAE